MDSEKNALKAARRMRGRPRDWDDKTEQNTIKSLDRAMRVLEYLSEYQGQSLSSLSADLEQSPATVYRILVTLQGRGLVEFDAAEQLWHIGPQAFVIGARFLRRTSLVDRARPILRRLMEQTGETANLGVVREHSVLFVSQVESHQNIRAFFPPGTLSPLHASGIGKALLSEMSEERLDRFLKASVLEAFTQHTLADAPRLREDLERIRQRGYAIDDEEKNIGMRCVAAPVFDIHGEAVAGISVSGPSSRIGPEGTDLFGRAVVDAASELTASLGGVPTRQQS